MADSFSAQAAIAAIHAGDLRRLEQLLDEHPELVNDRVDGQRTLLHVATDWPGHFPNSPETVACLLARGAEVNARFQGRHSETPLHWAASCDDVAVLDVLLDHGADIQAAGGVIANGTPLADAVAFAQWNAARRLIERGAVANLWQAAALGLIGRVEDLFSNDAPPAAGEITNAFWCACHGGQRETAEFLRDRGAEVNWIGYDGLTPLGAAVRNGNAELIEWLRSLGAKPSRA